MTFVPTLFACYKHNSDEVVDSVVGVTMSSTGFITFKDLSTLACAVKTPLFHKPDVLVVKMAPEPRDIIWENAHVNLVNQLQLFCRSLLLCIVYDFYS